MKRNTKKGWAIIGGKRNYFKSQWEAKYAAYLQFLKEKDLISEWEYEPQIFWFEGIKRGTTNYKPDFKVYRKQSGHYWVEVKGFMDRRSNTSLKRFKLYFPDEEMRVLNSVWFNQEKNILDYCKRYITKDDKDDCQN
jgi:hypothetical protein